MLIIDQPGFGIYASPAIDGFVSVSELIAACEWARIALGVRSELDREASERARLGAEEFERRRERRRRDAETAELARVRSRSAQFRSKF